MSTLVNQRRHLEYTFFGRQKRVKILMKNINFDNRFSWISAHFQFEMRFVVAFSEGIRIMSCQPHASRTGLAFWDRKSHANLMSAAL